MRRGFLPYTIALVSGITVGAVMVLFIGNIVEVRVDVQPATSGSANELAPVASPEKLPTSDDLSKRQMIDQASKLTTGGQLREAQELYLQLLLADPNEQEAMRGLVHVRRLIADGDQAALRQYAEEYQRAISQGVTTGDHYTAAAMELLATASLLAAAEPEDSGAEARAPVPPPQPEAASPASPSEAQPVVPKPQTQVSRPLPTTAEPPIAQAKPEPKTIKQPAQSKPEPATIKPAPAKPKSQTPRPKPQRKPKEVVRRIVVRRPAAVPAPPKPAPVQPPPPSLAQPTQEPESPIDEDEPFVTITVGPIASGARASSITTELTVAGYVARMRRGGTDYVITLGPYRRSVAERIASRIRAHFGQGVSVSLNPSSNN